MIKPALVRKRTTYDRRMKRKVKRRVRNIAKTTDLSQDPKAESREKRMQESAKEVEESSVKMSYRDSLRNLARMLVFDKEGKDGEQDQGEESEDSESSSEGEDDGPEEDGNGISIEKDVFGRFNLTLSDKEWKCLNKPYKKSLIIKLLGKTVGFKFLLRKVNQLWGRTGEVELVDLGLLENAPEQDLVQDTTEFQQKVWTKSKANLSQNKQEDQQINKEEEPADIMEIGSPIKIPINQITENPEITAPPKEVEPMIISPSKCSGDFNEIAYVTEQKGGSQPNLQRCNNFQSWIDRCYLIDIKPDGSFFTWEGPKRPNQEKLFKRLDRVMCSPSWHTLFKDASVKNIFKLHSDHFPMLVSTEEVCLNKSERPFRFEACWMQHEEFRSFLKEEWNKDASLNSTTEEIVWFQKARCQWIKDGNRNTKYYHTKAINRRRNKILMLKKENGDWTEDLEEIKGTVLSFFKNLFREDQNVNDFKDCWPHIDKTKWDCINIPFSDEEITRATFSIGGFRAPGSDGFPASFYHQNWEIISGNIINFVQSIWKWENIWEQTSYMNSLWVTVIASKYKISLNSFHSIRSKSAFSKLWKEMCRAWPEFYKNIYWEFENGSKIKYWKDNWTLNSGILIQNDPGIENIENVDVLAKYFINSQGDWNMGKISEFVPNEIIDRILDLNPPNPLLGPDQALWKPEKEGAFSISSAYNVVKNLSEPVVNNHWSAIWSCRIQQRQRIEPGSSPSLLKSGSVGILTERKNFAISRGQVSLLGLARPYGSGGMPKRKIIPSMRSEEYMCILQKAKVNAHTFSIVDLNMDRNKEVASMWSKPDRGWIKINTDGAVCRINGKAGCGRLLRDSNGEWVQGFTANLGKVSVTSAELRGMYYGLELAWNLGFKKIILESDAKGALNLISDNYQDDTNLNPALLNLKELIKQRWEVKVKHIPRSNNACADWLAKSSLVCRARLCILTSPPSSLIPLIQLDAGHPLYSDHGG
ncbi:ribonuclease H [Senna tora]|uniref:Ribonuclease H n=1 Tax=Senna tora TaxID=362788 RepID=A0A834SIB7_9FABA|nr:ribonuclease H [Senna tora]